jgi:4-amino-4-deoxy-L-arabinose transferase-like glycosyltransferase
VVFAVALLARLLCALWGAGRVPPTADGSFYHVVAARIADGHGYTWLWPDGAVTPAAHYPIGYPAALGALYALFSPTPAVGMVLNAVLGALGCAVAYALCRDALARHAPRATPKRVAGAALTAGLLVALSPTLVLYTPALMTEGPVASVLGLAAWVALRAESATRRRAAWLALLAGLAGAATLLRPQSLLFAPLLGYWAARGGWRARLPAAALVTAGAFALCAPWTLRNCREMGRCVMVSANGGWNLLIGTFPEGAGAWVPLEGERVPVECREVFDEAGKDDCFRRAGARRVREAPREWLALVPAKLRVTFDHTGSAAEHLRAAGALDERGHFAVGAVELVTQRLYFLLALLGALRLALRRGGGGWAAGAAIAALVGLAGGGAWLGLLGVLGLGAYGLVGRDAGSGLGLALAGIALTALVHAVFFGAGRYSMPLLVWLAPLAALGLLALAELRHGGWRELLTPAPAGGDNAGHGSHRHP